MTDHHTADDHTADHHTADGRDPRRDDRRKFLVRAAVAGAVAVPTVTSLSMDGLVIRRTTASAAGSVVPAANVIQDGGFEF